MFTRIKEYEYSEKTNKLVRERTIIKWFGKPNVTTVVEHTCPIKSELNCGRYEQCRGCKQAKSKGAPNEQR